MESKFSLTYTPEYVSDVVIPEEHDSVATVQISPGESPVKM